MEKMKVFTSFSGYDSQCLALDRTGVDYELVGWSEIDKFAIMAHNAIYPQYADRNFGDISSIDWKVVPDFDLFTMSSPCQDFSLAGLGRGGDEGSGTRSSLLWECRKAIFAKRPKYVLFENVKALVCAKFIGNFLKWQYELEGMGYSNFAKVLDASDYGVPQHRERIFMVSVLDCGRPYCFPKGFPLERRLCDVLEDEVDGKYYLSKRMLESFNARADGPFSFKVDDGKGISRTLTNASKTHITDTFIDTKKVVKTMGLYGSHQGGSIYDVNMISPTISGGGHGNTMPFVDERDVKKIMKIACIYDGHQSGIVYGKEGLPPTLGTMGGGNRQPLIVTPLDRNMQRPNDKLCPTLRSESHGNLPCVVNGTTIRKLTERECFRLMGVDEADIDKIQASGLSGTQQYKMSGNSIVVDVLYHIFRKLFLDTECEDGEPTLF